MIVIVGILLCKQSDFLNGAYHNSCHLNYETT